MHYLFHFNIILKHNGMASSKTQYKASPKRYWTFEIARQWASAGRLRRWCCVAGTLSFILTLATSHHFQLVMSYAALSEHVFSALGDFWQVEERRILKSNMFAWNSVSNWEKPLRKLFRCLWGGLFELYAMLQVVSAFQIGQNVHRRWSQIWTAFFVNGRRSYWESAFCDTWKSSSNYPWIVRRRRHL